MAGFSKVYFVGSTGGFMGADGVARPFVQILRGESSRQWYEPIYDDPRMSPLGGIKAFVPEGPNLPHTVLDAVILFLPKLFKDCPSLAKIASDLKGREMADFDADGLPAGWTELRAEALPIFRKLGVHEAEIVPLAPARYDMNIEARP